MCYKTNMPDYWAIFEREPVSCMKGVRTMIHEQWRASKIGSHYTLR